MDLIMIQFLTTPTGNLYLFALVQILYAFTLHSIFSSLPFGGFLGTLFDIEPNAQETFAGDWLAFAIMLWLAFPVAALTYVLEKRGPSADPILIKLHSVVLTIIFVIQANIIASGCKSAGGVIADVEMFKALAVNYVMLLVFGSVQRSSAGGEEQ